MGKTDTKTKKEPTNEKLYELKSGEFVKLSYVESIQITKRYKIFESDDKPTEPSVTLCTAGVRSYYLIGCDTDQAAIDYAKKIGDLVNLCL